MEKFSRIYSRGRERKSPEEKNTFRLYSRKDEGRLIEIIAEVEQVIPQEKRDIKLNDLLIGFKEGGDEIEIVESSFNHNFRLASLFESSEIYQCNIDIIFLSEILLNAEKMGWKYHKTEGEGIISLKKEMVLMARKIRKSMKEESELELSMSANRKNSVNESINSSYDLVPVYYLNAPNKMKGNERYIFTRFKNKLVEKKEKTIERDLLVTRTGSYPVLFEYDVAYSFLTLENNEREFEKIFS